MLTTIVTLLVTLGRQWSWSDMESRCDVEMLLHVSTQHLLDAHGPHIAYAFWHAGMLCLHMQAQWCLRNCCAVWRLASWTTMAFTKQQRLCPNAWKQTPKRSHEGISSGRQNMCDTSTGAACSTSSNSEYVQGRVQRAMWHVLHAWEGQCMRWDSCSIEALFI